MPHRIGTAAWSIPRLCSTSFPTEGTHLQRYARVLTCTEINSTFYRPHLPSTYAKWASSTPEGFLFSVKAPKTITHTKALDASPIQDFLTQSANLGEKRGPILFQFPPKQAFNPSQIEAFLSQLRDLYKGHTVFEPRHPTWFTEEADNLLKTFQIARAVADPPRVPAATEPAGDRSLVYFRLHGSPRIYYSSYSPDYLAALSQMLRNTPQAWCIFDNTAHGHATENALSLAASL